MKKSIVAVVCVMFVAMHATAAEKTLTLSIPGMNCPVCPVTVKKSLGKVSGVLKTSADHNKRQATVTFDDSKTNVQALLDATKNAGYPASVKE